MRALVIPVVLVLAACGSGAPPKAEPPKTGPLAVSEWRTLCAAEAEHARRCPTMTPEAVDRCTARMSCFGDVIRPDVQRAMAKCPDSADCRRPCTLERAAASLPLPAGYKALAESCAMRRIVCPALDCDAITRHVLALESSVTDALVDCMKLSGTCLEAANCSLKEMQPIVSKIDSCTSSDVQLPSD